MSTNKKFTIAQTLKHLLWFVGQAGIRPLIMFFPVALFFVSSLLEGLSMSLLVPVFQGLISGDFSFLMEQEVFRHVTNKLPSHFPQGNKNFIIMLTGLIFVSATGKILFQYLGNLTTVHILRRFTNKLRQLIFRRFLGFGKLYFDRSNFGHLLQISTAFVESIGSGVMMVQSAVYAFFTLLVYFVIMFYISWKLALIVTLVFPILHLALRRLINQIEGSSHSLTQAATAFGKQIANSLTTIPLMKAYTNERQEEERFTRLSTDIEHQQFSIDKRIYLVQPLQELLSLCFLLLLVGMIGFFVSRDPNANFAGYLVFILVLRRSSKTFGMFNQLRGDMAVIAGPMAEVLTVFNEDEKFRVQDGPLEFDKLDGAIEFKGLSYSYPGGVKALENIGIKIPSGKVTALVGHSGAGKSTLINILMRFYDVEPGSILVDGTDIREFSLNSWRSRIALVSQDAHLFNAPLRENVAYGLNGNVNDGDIHEAIERAELNGLLENLPEGLDALIGDRGVKLSGGEKQRVSIARAFVKDAEILILDEATSSLDSRTEREIQTALDSLMSERTTIVIAHRLSTIQHADNIVVLDQGKVVEEGALSELLEAKGLFYEYWEAQKFY